MSQNRICEIRARIPSDIKNKLKTCCKNFTKPINGRSTIRKNFRSEAEFLEYTIGVLVELSPREYVTFTRLFDIQNE